MCVPEVAEELPPTDVGEEHVEAVGVLEAPGQRHNEGVAHLPAKYVFYPGSFTLNFHWQEYPLSLFSIFHFEL